MQRQTGFSKESKRSPGDFYITPDNAIIALLDREKFKGVGWEPACGNGAITKFFPRILASDISNDKHIKGRKGVDFLLSSKKVDYIVTNPPFKLLLPFMEKSMDVAKSKVALFARLQALEGKKRYEFFQKYPPIRVYIFSNRVSCSTLLGDSANILCFAWYVWEIGFKGRPTLDWIMC